MTKILAALEQRDGALRTVSHEVVTGARHLAGPDGRVDALVLAAGRVTGLDPLGGFGADAVHVRTHLAFARHAPERAARVIALVARGGGYDAVLLAATAAGRDLAPRVAAKLRVPLAADVTELRRDGDRLVVRRPVYAGKAILTLAVSARPAVVSLRPSVFTPVAHDAPGTVDAAPADGAEGADRVVVREVKPAAGVLDVSEASIVVSGGRGLKEPANFALVEALARAFGGGAAVGASRAVVDAGWRPHAEQVGQTGKTVSPALYVAVGISGAVQHLAGMRSAKVIVAINRDRDAPIFKVADYGIVGDLFDVVPALTRALTQLPR